MSEAAAAPSAGPPVVSQYVLKVHSRCDLACDHCYVYEHADQTWRDRPLTMSPDTVHAAAKRIAEHASRHGVERVRIVLHGGEPLLLGEPGLRAVLEELKRTAGAAVRLDLGMQTNGVRLTAQICDLLLEHRVRVGVSLDGPAAANDLHRRFANGASSHGLVLRAVELLRRPKYRPIYGGLLCTIDVANDPIEVYTALAAQRPPRIDFLLPHATWERPPKSVPGKPTAYADWLGAVYDQWVRDDCPMSIRLFDSLRSLAAGGWTATEAIGLAPVDLVVVETDGAWEQADSLKTAYHGAAATQLDVFNHSVDEVALHPGIVARQGRIEDLCETCQRCPVVARCGGGLYAHRYRPGTGFANPSVYCQDLKTLIEATGPAVSSSRSGDGLVRVPQWMVEELATGYGDEGTMEFLASTQAEISQALLAEVIDGAPSAFAQAGWEVLHRLESEVRESVTRMMTHPFIRGWAMGCLTNGADRSYIASIAAAVAVKAGVPMKITVPVHDGAVILPSVGRVLVSGQTAEIITSPEGFTVQSGSGSAYKIDISGPGNDHWQPVRAAAVNGGQILIEDTDPHRDCFRHPVAPRLTAGETQAWRQTLEDAISIIFREVPEQLPGIRHALRSLVPLLPGEAGKRLSSAARNAFGAVAVAPTLDAAELAVLLVHELQHVKLGALLDLCELVDRSSPALFPVPWKPGLRPPEAVLQGTYSHLCIADIWRVRTAAAPEDVVSNARFHLYRGWTAEGIDTLLRGRVLTPMGQVFVETMDVTVRSWNGDL